MVAAEICCVEHDIACGEKKVDPLLHVEWEVPLVEVAGDDGSGSPIASMVWPKGKSSSISSAMVTLLVAYLRPLNVSRNLLIVFGL